MLTKDQIDEVEFWLKELEDVTRNFSEWELNFLESVTDQYWNNHSISEKQYAVLKRLYEKGTA